MGSFQTDFKLTINKSHELYMDKIDTLFNTKSITGELTIPESEKLIEYLKEYKNHICNINNTIDSIINIKRECNINTKIESELIIKMTPIMNVYRTLLFEKYTNQEKNKSSCINEQD